MKRVFEILFVLSVFCSGSSYAQIYDPVKWSFSLENKEEGVKEIHFKATVQDSWYVYDMNMPEDGPVSTDFTFSKVEGAQLQGKAHALTKPQSKRSELFGNVELRYFEREAIFVQAIKVTDPSTFKIEGSLVFMSCNDEMCLPPTEEEFAFGPNDLGKIVVPAKEPASTPKPEVQEEKKNEVTAFPSLVEEIQPLAIAADTVTPSTAETVVEADDLWTPVIDELQGAATSSEDYSRWYIFIAGFIGGFVAFLTPCVWPMIPMTVSFFLKRTKNRKKSIQDTLLYAFSIIVIYVALGLIVTLAFGASALNDLSTNAVFNLLFFALLVFFAVSFFGAFEIRLPSSWTTQLDSKADTTSGLLSIFLMAFTLSLVSFSCTGPIIGTLLVEAASSGSVTGPAIGMFGFAIALALPFALFAIFPTWMQSMPKSGGWLNVVKVVLGFIELALALKFLSVADLAYHWGILDREVFLVLWIVIFALLGIYLLGKLKFPHDSEVKHVSIPRLFLAIVSFAFAIYMVPGLWGAPLKAISAFSPPLNTQDFSLYNGEVHPKFKSYEEGMAFAAKENKPVLIDFTGFGCVNCRNMEAAVWTDPRVKDIIDNDYVLISLYVDDKQLLPETIEIEEYGKVRKLKTVGDKWSYLQRHKFGANAQPYYVLLDAIGHPVAPFYVYDKDIDKYLDFLKKGLDEYKRRK